MDGIPKMPMLSVRLKSSPVAPDISPIKKKVKKQYQDQMHINENMFRDFLALRTECCKLPNDESCLAHVRRYFAQLLLLKNRIDLTVPKFVEWPWQDAFLHKQFTRPEIEYEEAAILYCLGAAYALLGQKQGRHDVNSMKIACTNFQYAAYVFQSLRERYSALKDAPDMTSDLFHFYSLIMLNQAQECIVEKSIADKRPPNITAKIAKHLAEAYERCLSMANALPDTIPARLLKDWRRTMAVKKNFYAALVHYFLGTSNASEMRFGVSVAHLRLAQTSIETAWRTAKDFTDATEPPLGQGMIGAVQFAREVIVSCCAGIAKDNSELYHECVPQPSELEKVEGACLAKPFTVDYNDPAVLGEDIFRDLLPIETLSANSLYSEMKAKFMRQLLAEVEEKDSDLGSFLSSLNVDPKELLKPDAGLPQPLLDVCAQLTGMHRSPESELSSQMSALADVSVDVEGEVVDLANDLQTSTDRLNRLKSTAPAAQVTALSDRLGKIGEKHAKFALAAEEAKQSNSQLHGALVEHLAAVRTLLLPVEQIDAGLPNANDLISDHDLLEGLDEVARILAKVDQMRAQRTTMLERLREALQADDATQELLGTSSEHQSGVFDRRLASHEEAVKVIRMNLAAQANITKALVETHAKIGVKKHDILERRRKRTEEIDSLVRSGETFGDLLLKCAEGQTFYKEMTERLHGLRTELVQINAAIDDLEPKPHTPSPIAVAAPGTLPLDATPTSTGYPTRPGGYGVPPTGTTLREVLRARKAAGSASPPPPLFAPQSAQSAGGMVYGMPAGGGVAVGATPPTVNAQPSATASWNMQPRWQLSQPPPTSTMTTPPRPASGVPAPPTQMRPAMPAPATQSPPLRYPYYPSPYLFGMRYPSLSTPTPTTAPNSASTNPTPPQQQQQQQQARQSPYAYQPSGRAQQYIGGLPPNIGYQQYLPQVPGQQQPLPVGPQTSGMPQASPQQSPVYPQYQPQRPGGYPTNLLSQQQQQQYQVQAPGQQIGAQKAGMAPANLFQHPQYPGYQHYQYPAPGQNAGQPGGQIAGTTPVNPLQQQHPGYQQYSAQGPSQQHHGQPGARNTVPSAASALSKPQYPGYQQYATQAPGQQPPLARGQNPGAPLANVFQHSGQVLPQMPGQQPAHQLYPGQPPAQYMGYQYGPRPPYQYPQYGPPQPPMPYQYSAVVQPPAPINPAAPPQKQPGAADSRPAPPAQEVGVPATTKIDGGGTLPPDSSTAHPQPAEAVISQPKASTVGNVPPPITLLRPSNVPPLKAEGSENVATSPAASLPSTPITPTVLTQADLELQRREKQLRAAYDNAPIDPAQSSSTVINTVSAVIDSKEPLATTTTPSNPHADPLSDPLVINRFIDSTERLLTSIETMNDPLPPSSANNPTRAPNTRLDQFWLRVTEIATSGTDKRPTQAVARCSTPKNRRQDSIPYDFNRVVLNSKDDYINATNLDFISSLGEWCPRFILTQAPLPNTVLDFWSMIFDQACEVVVLLLPPRKRTTLLPATLDPGENYAEGAYGDPADRNRVPPHLPPLRIGACLQLSGGSPLELRLQALKFTRPNASQQSPTVDSISQSTCIERILTLTNRSSQQTRSIVHLCYSGDFPNQGAPASIQSFTAFTQTAVSFYKQQRSLMHPIAVVSECGGSLGGMFVASVAALLHAEVLGRVADVFDIVGRLCQQRRGAVEQPEQLAAVCAVVGTAARQILARRDIVVGPSASRRSCPNSDISTSPPSATTPQTNIKNGDDFATHLFTDNNMQLSEMISALGFAPTDKQKLLPGESSVIAAAANDVQVATQNSNGTFSDLPVHLVNLSLDEASPGSGGETAATPGGAASNGGRHYQARDFTDSAFRASRDALAGNTEFAHLDPLYPKE